MNEQLLRKKEKRKEKCAFNHHTHALQRNEEEEDIDERIKIER